MGIQQQIRELAKQDGRSSYRLALDAGIDQAAVLRFIRGDRDLRDDRLAKLCDALGHKIVLEKSTGGV